MNKQDFFETTLLIVLISFCTFVVYDYISSSKPTRKLKLWNFLSRNVSDNGEKDSSALIIAVFMIIVLSGVLIRKLFF